MIIQANPRHDRWRRVEMLRQFRLNGVPPAILRKLQSAECFSLETFRGCYKGWTRDGHGKNRPEWHPALETIQVVADGSVLCELAGPWTMFPCVKPGTLW